MYKELNTHEPQFAVGRKKTAGAVRKHFPLRPAAAKAIRRSQSDPETRVVVNFTTRKTVPHIHYVGLNRVTDIKGLYISDLCESKIAFNPDVKKQMERSRQQGCSQDFSKRAYSVGTKNVTIA